MNATQDGGELRALKLAVGLYAFTFGLKLAIYFVTGVMSMFAQAMHSLTDIIISVFLLLATLWSRKEADEEHMFGHGRAQGVAALVAATLFLSFTSFELYRESIPRLFQPEEGTYENLPLALGTLVFSMLLSAAPLVSLVRQKERGAAARAQLYELLNDELGMLAALVGTLFVMWGRPLADPIATVIIATIIAYNAVRLFWENLHFLVGRSPGPEFLAEVERVAESVEGVLGVHDLKAEYVGSDTVHAGLHIEVQRGTPIEEADRIAEEVEERVHRETDCQYCLIHVDPTNGNQLAAAGT